jgi:hypothetical protein
VIQGPNRSVHRARRSHQSEYRRRRSPERTPGSHAEGRKGPRHGRRIDRQDRNRDPEGRQGETATTGKGSKAAKAPSEDDIRTAFGAYMGVKDKDQRDERKAHVAKMIEHFGVERVTAIPEAQRAEALGYLKQLEAGETPDYAQGEEEERRRRHFCLSSV